MSPTLRPHTSKYFDIVRQSFFPLRLNYDVKYLLMFYTLFLATIDVVQSRSSVVPL